MKRLYSIVLSGMSAVSLLFGAATVIHAAEDVTHYFDEPKEGVYYLQNVHSGMYMEAEATRSGANVYENVFIGDLYQQFRIEDTGTVTKNEDTIFTISCVANSDYRIDVTGAKSKNGTNIELWKANTSAAQRFTIKEKADADGIYFIYAQTSSTPSVLELTGLNGLSSNIELWSYNGGANQQWRLVDVNDILGRGDTNISSQIPSESNSSNSLSASTEVKIYPYGSSAITVTMINRSSEERAASTYGQLQKYDSVKKEWISCPTKAEGHTEAAWVIPANSTQIFTFSLKEFEINGKLKTGRYQFILDGYKTEFIIQ